ncbi:YoaK family protein [Psychrobacter lutiphocae]|uniref:YoaK family protein n=1 Tax=Psychrobacter lutiphocae TaxID=540500 RepID=UPI00037B38D9|nr:YoaK family protein [Psychrobacter lutiphocae]
MITKLPRWILIGGAILAFSAGCVNIIALSGFTNLSVSHVTGNVSLFSAALARLDWPTVLFIGASLLSFLAGAILSGLLIGQRSLSLGRQYGVALVVEAALLALSCFLFFHHDYFGQLLAAAACGLQNAMVATYSGAVIRTTHLTGLTSDMGAAIGNWLAGRPINKMTLGFQAIIWYCFCGGGVVGAYGYFKFGYAAMLIPISIVLLAAIFYQTASNRLPAKRTDISNTN